MKTGRTYDEYIQSDWYKNHLEKKLTNKNAKVLSLDVKDKSYKKLKRDKVLTYLRSKVV